MSFFQLLVLQIRVIGALVLRETRASFGTSSIGYLWAILTPSISVGFLVAIFSLVGRQPPFGESLALFFATGILILEFFSKLTNTLMTTFSANKALLTYPLIKENDALFARYILISATYILIIILFYGALMLLDIAQWPYYFHEVVGAIFATSMLGFGFGVLNAVVGSLWSSWIHIEKILTRPLFFVSGIFYVPSFLPPQAIAVLKWNPVLHLVEWVREGIYPAYNSIVLDRSYPVLCAILFIFLGLFGERIYRKKRTAI